MMNGKLLPKPQLYKIQIREQHRELAVIIPCLNFLCFFLCFKTKKEKAKSLKTMICLSDSKSLKISSLKRQQKSLLHNTFLYGKI